MIKELWLYTSKISAQDIKNFVVHLTKPKLPLLGFIDLSGLFSVTPLMIIRRKGNTVKFYIQTNKSLNSYFLFPFRLGKEVELKRIKPGFLSIPIPIWLSSNFLEFLIKADIAEMRFKIYRLFGGYWVMGSAISSSGGWFVFFHPSAPKFLSVDLERYSGVYIELLEPIPKSMAFDSTKPIFEDEFGNKIGVDNFYPLAHTLVIGESGSGKTTFLLMFLKALIKEKPHTHFVIIDPHGEFQKRFDGEKYVIDFKNVYIEPLEIEGEYSPFMAQLITQQIMESIGNNTYAERVLFHAVHLLGSLGELTLKNLYAVLSDDAARMEFISRCEVEAVKSFFDTEFTDIQIHHFNDAILPLLNFITEYNLYLKEGMKKVSLLEAIKRHRVVVVSFDPDFFGKRMIHFFGASIINQMYILALTGKLDNPTFLVIDEVARVETPTLKDILAETRKFNLYLMLSTQYLGQLEKAVVDAILSNAKNIIAFKLHEKDAALLAGAMEIKFEDYFTKVMSAAELEEKKKELFVRLAVREAIVRLFDGERYLPPAKVQTVGVEKWNG